MLKLCVGIFFLYECVFIKFIVLVFLVIGIFICVGFVGVEVNIVLLIWKIDIFVDICEKNLYILIILFYVGIFLYVLKRV